MRFLHIDSKKTLTLVGYPTICVFMDTKFIIHLIGKIHDKSNKFLIKELKKHNIKGIVPSHGDILGALCLADQLKMKELAGQINKDKSTVTTLVNKLIS